MERGRSGPIVDGAIEFPWDVWADGAVVREVSGVGESGRARVGPIARRIVDASKQLKGATAGAPDFERRLSSLFMCEVDTCGPCVHGHRRHVARISVRCL